MRRTVSPAASCSPRAHCRPGPRRRSRATPTCRSTSRHRTSTTSFATPRRSFSPLAHAWTWASTEQDNRYTSIRTGLSVGAACVLFLIGASLLVSQLEQLRERKKLLSVLVAFGTRRRTLSLSVLWQTAIPIALGLLLASVVGVTLGVVLQKMTSVSVRVDWPSLL